MMRWLRWIALGLMAAVIVTYAGDWALFNIRGARTAKVTVSHFVSAPLKNNKQEIDYLGSDEQICSFSLFPQGGYTPYWYLRKHTNQVTTY